MIEFLNSGKKKNILYFAKFPDIYFTIQVLFERFATNKLWTKLHGVRRYFDYEDLSKGIFKQMLEFEHVLSFIKCKTRIWDPFSLILIRFIGKVHYGKVFLMALKQFQGSCISKY